MQLELDTTIPREFRHGAAIQGGARKDYGISALYSERVACFP
jgi:hypothetical protein